MVNQSDDRPALVVEDAVEPELPICDPHHHFWDRDVHRGGDRYLLDELTQDLSGGHNVTHTVFIECRSMYRAQGPEELRSVGETEFVQGIAAQSASGNYGPTAVAAGIVSNANLMLGAAVEPVLEAHLAASGNRFRGIRFSCAWDASPEVGSPGSNAPGMLLDSRFREGFACLQKLGLSFDALVYHTQLEELADLADAFPDATIILNHIGRPLGIGPYSGKGAEVFDAWQEGITAVAQRANVLVKLGGFGNPISGYGWHQRPIPPSSTELVETITPWLMFCIEQFGPERCMFESNFPVDKASYNYTAVWNAFKLVSQGFSASERAAMFQGTAVKAYRL
ncbi:MAG: amidohydrolase family protein [Chloroflexi bacterium]|nr:amidohydrolase family protein [Chloroflexota bacterium]